MRSIRISLVLCVILLVTAAFAAAPAMAESLAPAVLLPATTTQLALPVTAEDTGPPGTLDQIVDMFAGIETRTIYIYSFEDKASSLGLTATIPVWSVSPSLDVTIAGVLKSNDGFSFGLGGGVTIKDMLKVLDVIGGYTPQGGWFVGAGISKRL